MKEFSLRVGEDLPIKRGLLRKSRLIYAGMTGEKVFSLVVTLSIGYNSMAYNLFFPVSKREVMVGRNRLTVLRVSEDEIHIRDEG